MSNRIGSGTTRRSVLKTTGAVGLLSLAGASGTVAAKDGDAKNDGDIDAFLNHPAAFKESPIWDGIIHDMTGMSEVVVDVGAMTSIDLPPGAPPLTEAPVAFAPQAIYVSPGTDVTWTWLTGQPVPDVPHDVTARKIVKGSPLFQSELQFPDEAEDFTHTFDDVGEYLYYCTPHGAPFAVESFLGGKVNNEFGMRGAVVVVD